MEAAVPRSRSRQYLTLGLVFTIVLAVLIAGYWLFLRPGYTVLVDSVRPAEAATIVAELDKRGVAYQLKDGGTTILVPAGQADATRLAIVGSDAAATGQVGFELFNKSDMGLTNFAQKINYQRALQGELVRTITQMDGVESARVHLALPERALFRDDRTEPSAAVTIALKPGQLYDPARVSGIQRLVAAAVPDLPANRVAVLDARGRVISQTVDPDAAPTVAEQPAALEERAAVEQYYRARARRVIEGQLPSIRFTLKASAVPLDGMIETENGWMPSGEGAARNYRLRLTMVTPAPLAPAQQLALREALTPALALQAQQGDEILFDTAPIVDRAIAPLQSPPLPNTVPAPVNGVAAHEIWTPDVWWIVALVAIVAAFLVWRRRLARQTQLSDADHDAFAQTLRRQLAPIDEGGHVAR